MKVKPYQMPETDLTYCIKKIPLWLKKQLLTGLNEMVKKNICNALTLIGMSTYEQNPQILKNIYKAIKNYKPTTNLTYADDLKLDLDLLQKKYKYLQNRHIDKLSHLSNEQREVMKKSLNITTNNNNDPSSGFYSSFYLRGQQQKISYIPLDQL